MSTPALAPPDLRVALTAELASVRNLLSPATVADIQERIWDYASRLEELEARAVPPPAPVATRPRCLPRPLNPLYFVRSRRQI